MSNLNFTNTCRSCSNAMSDYWIDKDPDSKSYNKWMIGNKSTGIDARGLPGVTPHIGPNGNWWIGDTDTWVSAEPEDLEPQTDTEIFF